MIEQLIAGMCWNSCLAAQIVVREALDPAYWEAWAQDSQKVFPLDPHVKRQRGRGQAEHEGTASTCCSRC